MNNEMTNTPPFKVKCTYIDNDCLTVGKEYNVVEVDEGFYKVKNDSGESWWYHNGRFQIVETPPKDKQEFSVGDMVTINKISDDFVSDTDENVKVGDVATVTKVESCGKFDVRLTNPNWDYGWWFYKDDVSLVTDNNPLDDNSLDYHPLSHQEIISEIALQLLPTVYSKAVDSIENNKLQYYEGWKDVVIAESFKLAEAYYDYKEKYLKETL